MSRMPTARWMVGMAARGALGEHFSPPLTDWEPTLARCEGLDIRPPVTMLSTKLTCPRTVDGRRLVDKMPHTSFLEPESRLSKSSRDRLCFRLGADFVHGLTYVWEVS
jgi:hypothetical protein